MNSTKNQKMGDRPHFTQLKNFKQKYNLLGTSNTLIYISSRKFPRKRFSKKEQVQKIEFGILIKFLNFFLKSFERFLKKNLAFRAFFLRNLAQSSCSYGCSILQFLFQYTVYYLVYLYPKITKTRRRDSNKGPDERRIG